MKSTLKDIELRLMSELMKNSRRTNGELAKELGTSRPKVDRMIKKLEDEGVIREYTVIPDFGKLGFDIMPVIFKKIEKEFAEYTAEEAKKKVLKKEKENPCPLLLAANGTGYNFDRLSIFLSEDYSGYVSYLAKIGKSPPTEDSEIGSFLVDQNDEIGFMPLTFRYLAEYLEKRAREPRRW